VRDQARTHLPRSSTDRGRALARIFAPGAAAIQQAPDPSTTSARLSVLGAIATTLSGGESQRVKLATERWRLGHRRPLTSRRATTACTSPTSDAARCMNRLWIRANTVGDHEHNRTAADADWIVDLGPDGGNDGGRLSAPVHSPEEVSRAPKSYTGQILKKCSLRRNAIVCTRSPRASRLPPCSQACPRGMTLPRLNVSHALTRSKRGGDPRHSLMEAEWASYHHHPGPPAPCRLGNVPCGRAMLLGASAFVAPPRSVRARPRALAGLRSFSPSQPVPRYGCDDGAIQLVGRARGSPRAHCRVRPAGGVGHKS